MKTFQLCTWGFLQFPLVLMKPSGLKASCMRICGSSSSNWLLISVTNICFAACISVAQGFLLALGSGIAPGKLRGTILCQDSVNLSWLSTSIHSILQFLLPSHQFPLTALICTSRTALTTNQQQKDSRGTNTNDNVLRKQQHLSKYKQMLGD